jgi:hypothetical protein
VEAKDNVQAQLQATCIDVLERCGSPAPPITLLLAHALTRTPTCSPRYPANANHACSRRRRKGHIRCQWQLVAGVISRWPQARCVHPRRGSRVRLPWRVRACVVEGIPLCTMPSVRASVCVCMYVCACVCVCVCVCVCPMTDARTACFHARTQTNAHTCYGSHQVRRMERGGGSVIP